MFHCGPKTGSLFCIKNSGVIYWFATEDSLCAAWYVFLQISIINWPSKRYVMHFCQGMYVYMPKKKRRRVLLHLMPMNSKCIAPAITHSQRTDLIALVLGNRTYYFLSGSYSDQIVLFLFYNGYVMTTFFKNILNNWPIWAHHTAFLQ